MALLNRFVRMPDRANTHVFTFIVTRSVTRDLHRDVTSKEFCYGHHRWAITFSRAGKVLGVYLVWRNPSEGMRVYIDFSFTLLNRDHFSANETFSGRQIKFTYDSPAQGNRRYIPVDDLYDRSFTDPNGEFQLELTLANVRTIYETELRLPPAGTNAPAHSPLHGHNASNGGTQTSKSVKVESTYFSFGGFDWNVAASVEPFSVAAAATAAGFSLNLASNLGLAGSPNDRDKDKDKKNHGDLVGNGSLALRLRRLTGVDHVSRARYFISIGEGDRRVTSGILDDTSDAEGMGSVWYPRGRLQDIAPKGMLRLQVELISANMISETLVTVNVNQASPGAIASANSGTCYDRDKQAWCLEPDTHSDALRVRMVYRDVRNVPRNHIRYVSWVASLLRNGKTGQTETIPFNSSLYSNYYIQEEVDDGVIMESSITIKELQKFGTSFMGDKQQLRIQVEWDESLLLFQATYHKYDDVCRIHNYQMRREITALQAENYSLERQLFSYQRSLAIANARCQQPSEDTPSSANGEYRDYQRDYYSRRESTDTEYA